MAPSKQWMQLVEHRLDETYLVDGDEVEECESEDVVEELLRDLYPNLDGGTTHTDGDDLLEEEPMLKQKDVIAY
ncbi:hypothetical protein KY289_020274 [Solanum tuberosum]|nr:hypothetical protein KY289_020274 [Solanum tuberosum]